MYPSPLTVNDDVYRVFFKYILIFFMKALLKHILFIRGHYAISRGGGGGIFEINIIRLNFCEINNYLKGML